MADLAIHWHEEMFLKPQHFQTVQRYWSHQIERNAKWDHHYNWGLRSIDLDLDSLANYRVAVHALEARMHDGTIIIVSPDDKLAPLSLRNAFDGGRTAMVYLGIPVLYLGRPNVAKNGDDRLARFLLDSQELEDENTGQNPQRIPVRKLNVRLMLTREPGYDCVPLARLQKAPQAEAPPQLDLGYIPPLLACDAWRPLSTGVLQTIYDQIAGRVELLAQQVLSRGITFDSHTQGDLLIFNQLRVLNEAYSTFGVLAFARGVHPSQAFGELCRLVGQLAIFSDARRTPDLPVYDHDDLAGCFFTLQQQIDSLLNFFAKPKYEERAFQGAGMRMQVALEPAWVGPRRKLYVGVRSSLKEEECVRLLTQRDRLDMKVGSSERVAEIFRMGAAGIRLTHVAHPPRDLPTRQGLVFFEVSHDATDPEWQYVQHTLSLAIQMNESWIKGDIEGQRVLTIGHAGGAATLEFSLYVLAEESAK